MAHSEIIPDIKIPKTIEVIHEELLKRQQQYEKICKQFAPDPPVNIGDQITVVYPSGSKHTGEVTSIAYDPYDKNLWKGWKIRVLVPMPRDHDLAIYIHPLCNVFKSKTNRQ